MLSLRLFLCFCLCSIANSVANSSYELFDKGLPVPLAGHISVVYSGTLYLFGGQTEPTTPTYNYNLYSLDLAALNIVLDSAQSDIVIQGTANWVETTLDVPTYGTSNDGSFYCDGQCYTKLDNYLYIFSAASSSATQSSDVYRLDLDTHTFSVEADFNVSTPSDAAEKGQCVTNDGSDTIYVLSGWKSGYSIVSYKLTVSSETWTKLGTMPGGRHYASCAVGSAARYVYLIGGKSSRSDSTKGSDSVTIYDSNQDSWDDADWQFVTPDPTYDLTWSTHSTKAIRNPFVDILVIPSGGGKYQGVDTVNPMVEYWDIRELATYRNTSTVAQPVFRYGFNIYAFDAKAYLAIITGGTTSVDDQTISNATQYSVIVKPPTMAPTVNPTKGPSTDPSTTPTASPSADPSGVPTSSPSQEPTSGSPTPAGQEVEEPTDNPTTGSAAVRVVTNSVFSFFLVLVFLFS